MFFSKPGLTARLAALCAGSGTLLFRPMDMLLYAGLYSLFGLNPLPWQLVLLGINVLLANAVRRLLSAYGVSDPLALLGAVLFLAYPNKDATMFWPVVMVNSLGLLLFLEAYLLHLSFLATGRASRAAASAGMLAAALSAYDQTFLLFPIWLVSPKAIRGGRAGRGFLAAAAAVAALCAYKLWFLPRFFGLRYPKTFQFWPGHAVSIYWGGLLCAAGPELARAMLRSAGDAFRSSPAVALAAAALPWALLPRLEGPRPSAQVRAAPLARLGAGLFVLGWLPVAVSNYFPPGPLNHMNRLNQVPTLGLLLAALGAVQRAARSPWADRLGRGAASLLLAAHVGFAGYWAESYRQQMEVRGLVRRFAAQWPPGTTLLLLLPDLFVAGKAPIFLAHWDISGAAQIWTGDRGRAADVVRSSTDFRPEGVLQSGRLLPYGAVRLLEVRRGIFATIKPGDMRRAP